jgi:hypothetical protein
MIRLLLTTIAVLRETGRKMHPNSMLLITLDSCRYDTFLAASAPHMKSIGLLHRAMAPATFTFGSHASIFVGFTPGAPDAPTPFVNPKFAKIFKLDQAGFPGFGDPFFSLTGRNIIEGFKQKGYLALGCGGVGWFNPSSPTGAVLTESFDKFFYAGDGHSLDAQLAWIYRQVDEAQQPVFLFLNVGETHVPYYHKGAPWDRNYNPCVPFRAADNDARECRRRQLACVEYVDFQIAPLLKMFKDGTTVICADHGDCWGEDDLWEHGISHPKVLEVPLLMRLSAH